MSRAFSPCCVCDSLLVHAALDEMEQLKRALMVEQSAEREIDQYYWLPLRAESEKLRRAK